MLLPCLFALSDCVHRKRSRARKPDRVAGALVEFEERIAVTRRAVADARALGEWAGIPDRVPGFNQHAVHVGRPLYGKVRKAGHDARRAVAPLEENLGAAGTWRLGNGRPVGTIVLED